MAIIPHGELNYLKSSTLMDMKWGVPVSFGTSSAAVEAGVGTLGVTGMDDENLLGVVGAGGSCKGSFGGGANRFIPIAHRRKEG